MLLTRLPLSTYCIATAAASLDLHVLSTPPAFTLSQDQTLQKKMDCFYYGSLITFKVQRWRPPLLLMAGCICSIVIHTPYFFIFADDCFEFILDFLLLGPRALTRLRVLVSMKRAKKIPRKVLRPLRGSFL